VLWAEHVQCVGRENLHRTLRKKVWRTCNLESPSVLEEVIRHRGLQKLGKRALTEWLWKGSLAFVDTVMNFVPSAVYLSQERELGHQSLSAAWSYIWCYKMSVYLKFRFKHSISFLLSKRLLFKTKWTLETASDCKSGEDAHLASEKQSWLKLLNCFPKH
jgi:hypothetical protein